ncbi:GntR family transcriptional regulator [Melghirimyces algeriensis]|uniref:DNA-binding transcriptional regulator, GntR family n=1 Tax=Melghirimyces algeriensis TaxID=910412 RepID=A0A521B166_9BACL|nr:GntR family transcriptional regulator [Melghirimyces algeriensis]SMO40765.1 DNA-binding transcriptional regulator, GntR family [Melghirimyces algeriensis]
MPIPSDFEKYSRISAKERVFRQVRDWITDGTLQPGEKIIDKELAEAIGVSRTPVREALQILEYQGFVEMQPGKETKVTQLSDQDVFQLYPPLAALDSLAVKLAVDRINEKTLQELRHINEQFSIAVSKKNRNLALEWDERFHRMIVQTSANPYIAEFTSLLHRHIRRMKFVFFNPSMIPAKASVEEHRKIIEALNERDGESAAQMMKQNWLRAMDIVVNEIRKSDEEEREG